MRFRSSVLVGSVVCLSLVLLVAGLRSEQAAPSDLVRSELTLSFRTVSVEFAPDLRADDPAHRTLLSAEGPTAGGVRVARLQTNPLLRFGTLRVETSTGDAKPSSPPQPKRYDLWLKRTDGWWELEARPTSDDAAAAPAQPEGTIPLSHRAGGEAVQTFSAALLPSGDDAGQLRLRWGPHEWRADFQLDSPPPPSPRQRRQAPLDGSRTFEADNSAFFRATRLAERHESALVLSGERHVSVLFWKKLEVDSKDFASIASLSDGAVVRLTAAAVPRLRTDVPLRFGRTTIRTDNLTTGFPGAYGLWLKKKGRGWHLVFNHEADSWGTQHDPAFDAAEIELAHSEDGPATRPFGVALVPTMDGSGRLVLHWGPHQWTADFTVQ